MKMTLNPKLFLVALTFLFMTVQAPLSVSAHGALRDAHTIEQMQDQWLQLVQNQLVQNAIVDRNPQAASSASVHADFQRPVTKADFIKMLVKTVFSKTGLKRQIDAASACSFSSVQDKETCKYLELAKKEKLLSGYSSGAFAPESSITRAEVLFFASQMMPAKLTSDGIRQTFTDVDMKHWAYDAITWGVQLHFMAGFPDGTFKPDQPATQSEVMLVLYDVAKLVKQAGSMDAVSGKKAGAKSSGDVTIVWSSAMNVQSNVIAPGQTVPLSVELINAKKNSVSLKWNAAEGAITDQQGTSALWTAPTKEGTYVITVSAVNKNGKETSVSEPLIVSNLAVEEEFIFGDPANFEVVEPQDP